METFDAEEVYGAVKQALSLGAMGLSGFPCKDRFLCDFKTSFKEDGELGFGHCPFSWRHFPLLRRQVQHQI